MHFLPEKRLLAEAARIVPHTDAGVKDNEIMTTVSEVVKDMPRFIYCLGNKLESNRMAPKETQKIEIEKTHRDPLLSCNQAVTANCSNFLGTARMSTLRSSTLSW